MSDIDNPPTTGSSADTTAPADALVVGTLHRPGELLREAVAVAEQLGHSTLITLTDPRDGTQALARLGRTGIGILDAKDFDQYREKPLRRLGTAAHTRLDSFIAHVLRFKAAESAIFAIDDPTAPRLTAIFDYHPEGPENVNALNLGHRASYNFPLSDEWKTWQEMDGKPMNMVDFAAFLENNIINVLQDPVLTSKAAQDFIGKTGGNIATPSKLMEISKGLQINENSTFREARNLSSGEAELVYTSNNTDAAGDKLVLPNYFVIGIPVFARSPDRYQIIARFRYRKVPGGGSVVFWYELWRDDLVFEDAFNEASQQVATQTALPLFVGKPES